ncbi:hypothetical protein [Actinomadura sp. GTD37]|uniref:hypothetical protein n=1 Tax=Actinomadura sp. GTD37 TaxID=1778030 RepID=UPI0035C24E5F
MRLPRWAPWVQEILTGSPAITQVQSFADAGIADRPCGHVITLRTGANVAVQWVRTSASGGEDQSQPEEPVTREAPAPVTLPELPSSGRTPLTLVEEHLAALITNGGSAEIREVARKSTRPEPGPRPCGIAVHMHSGADVFGVFLHTAPAGGSFSGGEFQQREEV